MGGMLLVLTLVLLVLTLVVCCLFWPWCCIGMLLVLTLVLLVLTLVVCCLFWPWWYACFDPGGMLLVLTLVLHWASPPPPRLFYQEVVPLNPSPNHPIVSPSRKQADPDPPKEPPTQEIEPIEPTGTTAKSPYGWWGGADIWDFGLLSFLVFWHLFPPCSSFVF